MTWVFAVCDSSQFALESYLLPLGVPLKTNNTGCDQLRLELTSQCSRAAAVKLFNFSFPGRALFAKRTNPRYSRRPSRSRKKQCHQRPDLQLLPSMHLEL